MPTKTEKVSGIAKFRQQEQLRKARTNLRARAVILVVGKRGDVVECTMRGRGECFSDYVSIKNAGGRVSMCGLQWPERKPGQWMHGCVRSRCHDEW